MTGDMDRMAGRPGRSLDDGAATGDSSKSVTGGEAGRSAGRTDFAAGGNDEGRPERRDTPDEKGSRNDSEDTEDALDRVHLDGLDADGGTTIPGPQDRTDIANLRGGQHDAATGGSDLAASTGGADTGAV